MQILRKLTYLAAPRSGLIGGHCPELFAADIVCAQERIHKHAGEFHSCFGNALKLGYIAVQTSAKLALFKEYLHVLIELGLYCFCLFAAAVELTEKYRAVGLQVIEDKCGLVICQRQILVDICKAYAV